MALLSFVESAPRAYRLKVGNADLFRNSTEPGTSPRNPMAKKKRGKLSESAPVVRPLDAKGKDRIPNHEKIVVITYATLDSVMQLPGAFQ